MKLERLIKRLEGKKTGHDYIGHDYIGVSQKDSDDLRLNSIVETILYTAYELGFPDPFTGESEDSNMGDDLFRLLEWLADK